ncbi:hypothetical protein [Streptomyces sp. NPDC059883]|uniref:hypothetical protein n=1 Tax=unclassified Streptomyces TaxID=2593676 RepID=UPI0036496C1C
MSAYVDLDDRVLGELALLLEEPEGHREELCRRGDRSVGQIAKDFDLTQTAVRLWVSQAEVGAGEKDGLTTELECVMSA